MADSLFMSQDRDVILVQCRKQLTNEQFTEKVKDIIKKQIRTLSRVAVGTVKKKKVWGQKPHWWDAEVSKLANARQSLQGALEWRNPTEGTKDTKEILVIKYEILRRKLKEQNTFPKDMEEEDRLWEEGSLADLVSYYELKCLKDHGIKFLKNLELQSKEKINNPVIEFLKYRVKLTMDKINRQTEDNSTGPFKRSPSNDIENRDSVPFKKKKNKSDYAQDLKDISQDDNIADVQGQNHDKNVTAFAGEDEAAPTGQQMIPCKPHIYQNWGNHCGQLYKNGNYNDPAMVASSSLGTCNESSINGINPTISNSSVHIQSEPVATVVGFSVCDSDPFDIDLDSSFCDKVINDKDIELITRDLDPEEGLQDGNEYLYFPIGGICVYNDLTPSKDEAASTSQQMFTTTLVDPSVDINVDPPFLDNVEDIESDPQDFVQVQVDFWTDSFFPISGDN